MYVSTLGVDLTTWKDGSANHSGIGVACVRMCVSVHAQSSCIAAASSTLKDGTGTGTVESRLLPTEKSKLANR